MDGHGHRFNPDKAGRLLDPKRKETITPETVIALLDLKSNEVVADLGAGNGYFTVPMALITNQTVLAVDIETKMLNLLKEHAQKANVSNINYFESDLENIPVPDHSVDKVLIAFVIHEVPDRIKVYEELKRIKKPDSKIVILEWQAVEMEMGPPIKERISSEKLKEEIMSNGLTPEVIDVNNRVYAVRIQ